jgi:hypothetical protein
MQMEPVNTPKYNGLYYTALVCAVWFMLTSVLWTYAANFIISFPFGLLSWLLWLWGKGRDAKKQRYKKIGAILLFGVFLAFASLMYFIAFE